MVTNYKKTRGNFLEVNTTKLVTIDTGSATAYTITSGSMGMEVTNDGPATVFYGHSSIVQGSGAFLAMYMTKDWFQVVDDFTVYFRADSAQSVISVTEYR